MNSKDREKRNKTIRSYAKYSGLAYQLVGLVVVSLFIGLKADKYFGNTENNYITAILVIVVFFAYMYRLYIILIKNDGAK